MNYEALVDELINNLLYYNDGNLIYHKQSMKDIIHKHQEEPTLKLVIDDCKVRNVVTGEIK